MFKSEIEDLGRVRIPPFSGTRVMMMPFRIEDADTVPFFEWRSAVSDLLYRIGAGEGVGYLTIDEAEVPRGETHRRPGLHVDGARGTASWSPAPPNPYGHSGMILAASHVGCAGYPGEFEGLPDVDGNCEHLRSQLRERVEFAAGRAYWCGHHAVHEALPMPEATRRQLLRVSMPSGGVWFSNYTPSPYGILPTGPVLPAREEMKYRP